jgi:hypothetical protein
VLLLLLLLLLLHARLLLLLPMGTARVTTLIRLCNELPLPALLGLRSRHGGLGGRGSGVGGVGS